MPLSYIGHSDIRPSDISYPISSDIGYPGRTRRQSPPDCDSTSAPVCKFLTQMKTFKALEMAIDFYEQATRLKVTGHLKDQLHRAASSITLNLSEGNAKGTAKDKRHFFQMSYGSLRECQTIFKLLKVEEATILNSADRLGACLYKLVNSQLKDSPNWR